MSKYALYVFCFANTARKIDSSAISLNFIKSTSKLLGGGTRLEPLVSAFEDLPVRDISDPELVVVTDGEFSDSSNELKSKLATMFAKIEQVGDKDSLARISRSIGNSCGSPLN